MLGGHPEIFCHGNVFAGHMMAVFWPKANRPSASETAMTKSDLRQLRDADPDAFLDRVFSMNFDRAHVGFKIFRGQNDEILHKLVLDPSVRKVVLFRRNVLANYSSAMIAKASDTWDVVKDETAEEVKRVQFEEGDFIKFHNNFIRYYKSVISDLNASKQQYHFINYEDINDAAMLNSLINFLGADTGSKINMKEIRKQQVKQNTSDILQRFSNPEDVVAFLTKYDRLHWKYEGETAIAPLRRDADAGTEADTTTAEDADAG
jgi:hypothetical protein